MKKGENPNHPKAGSRITVGPIRDIRDIQAIKKLLSESPLYTAIFTVGINTNLRASDLLLIKACQVRDLKPMDEITLREKKTGKPRRINLNKACVDAINDLLKSRDYQADDYLFIGQRGKLTVSALSQLVKKWCKTLRIPGNYASHTMRKTWGYHQRVTYGAGLPEIMAVYGHASERGTLNYLCVQPDEIRSLYKNTL
jgi:integrase